MIVLTVAGSIVTSHSHETLLSIIIKRNENVHKKVILQIYDNRNT